MPLRRPTVLLLVGGLVVASLLHLALQVEPGLTADPADHHNLLLVPLIGAGFCVLNAILLMGPRRALQFLAVAAVLGWLVEQIGVTTGYPFGHYRYADHVLGPKLGAVPLAIPLFWFLLIYLSFVITNLITEDVPDDLSEGSILNETWQAFLAGLIATAYDLGLDPYMASPEVGAWTWTPPPPETHSYFGVPVRNFYGWILTAFLISLIARRLDHRTVRATGRTVSNLACFTPRAAKLIALVPVAFYLVFWLGHLSHNHTPPVVVISLVALGIPSMAAVSNWRRWRVGPAG